MGLYQAPIVAASIAVMQLYRILGKKRERANLPMPLEVHHYTLMYTVLFVLLCMACVSLVTDVLIPTHCLLPESVTEFVHKVILQTSPNATSTENEFKIWQDESDLSGCQWLKYFALSAPCWCLATFAVCAKHTWDHVKQIKKSASKKLCDHEDRDQVIVILALPLVYGLMSFKSVIRALQICINHVPAQGDSSWKHVRFKGGYEERKAMLLEMYNANFQVGDIYETIALVTFGQLVTTYLKQQLSQQLQKRRTSMNEEDHRALSDTLDHTIDSLAEITLSGVWLFAGSCLMSGVYGLFVTAMFFYFPGFKDSIFSLDPKRLGMLQEESMKSSIEKFFLGFGFAASFAAINNLISVESKFHDQLKEFRPSSKFWGTKVLVSLACVQSCLLVLLPLTTIQKDLFYAAVLCMECFFIALFHTVGWKAKEGWYSDQTGSMAERLLL